MQTYAQFKFEAFCKGQTIRYDIKNKNFMVDVAVKTNSVFSNFELSRSILFAGPVCKPALVIYDDLLLFTVKRLKLKRSWIKPQIK